MPATPTILGTPTDVIWGTNGVFASGRIIKARKMSGLESDKSLDNNGIVTGEVWIPKEREYDFDVEGQVSITPPNRGDTITVLADTLVIVDSVETSYARKGRQTIAIKGHSYPTTNG
jgi:hypothetical protein